MKILVVAFCSAFCVATASPVKALVVEVSTATNVPDLLNDIGGVTVHQLTLQVGGTAFVEAIARDQVNPDMTAEFTWNPGANSIDVEYKNAFVDADGNGSNIIDDAVLTGTANVYAMVFQTGTVLPSAGITANNITWDGTALPAVSLLGPHKFLAYIIRDLDDVHDTGSLFDLGFANPFGIATNSDLRSDIFAITVPTSVPEPGMNIPLIILAIAFFQRQHKRRRLV